MVFTLNPRFSVQIDSYIQSDEKEATRNSRSYRSF